RGWRQSGAAALLLQVQGPPGAGCIPGRRGPYGPVHRRRLRLQQQHRAKGRAVRASLHRRGAPEPLHSGLHRRGVALQSGATHGAGVGDRRRASGQCDAGIPAATRCADRRAGADRRDALHRAGSVSREPRRSLRLSVRREAGIAHCVWSGRCRILAIPRRAKKGAARLHPQRAEAMMRCRRPVRAAAIAAMSICAGPMAVSGQSAARDSLRLDDLQNRAVQHDPRTRQLDLLTSQSALRLQDIDASQLPVISANADGQYQSQVVTLPLRLPNGLSFPVPPHDTYDAHVGAQQPIYDPTVRARRGVERAQLAASQAAVQTSTFALRQNVNDAYFSALLQQAQYAEQESAITDLEARRKVAASRVAQGAALRSETEMLDAELLRRRQAATQLAAGRDAALVVLGDLTGQQIPAADALVLPDLSAAVARVRQDVDTLRARPEYEQFARSRDVLAQQQTSLGAADLPRVSAFGRAGYGRPGLNPLAQAFSNYWLAGVQVEWTPWNWGATRRDREVLELQRQIVATNEAAFDRSVQRSIAREVASIDQLAQTLADDDTIVALRENILRETGFRFSEGVVTSADYVDRETDLLDARLSRATHRVQLAQARANFLTSLGLGVH